MKHLYCVYEAYLVSIQLGLLLNKILSFSFVLNLIISDYILRSTPYVDITRRGGTRMMACEDHMSASRVFWNAGSVTMALVASGS